MLLRLINLAEQKINDENKVPTRIDYVKKREIDRSTLYSFDGPFQLIHADLGNLEFLGKSATTPKYALLAVKGTLIQILYEQGHIGRFSNLH